MTEDCIYCHHRNKKVKYLVKEEKESVHKFVVVEDLGHDYQGGHYFKQIVLCTVKTIAETVASQLNNYNVIYLPGNIFG